MIEITKEEYKNIKNSDPKTYYKNNLQGKDIYNPVLGKILFTQLGLGETFHRTKRNLRPFICLLKPLVETGECDGKLESLYKPRKDRITGFYHIKNKVKLAFIKVSLDILIGQDQDSNKYYMFKKDPQGDLGEDFSSQRGPSGSNNIITENDIDFKTELENDFKDVKSGQEFWIGDTIKIIIEKEEISESMNIKSINEKLDKFLNEGIQGEDVELVVVLRKLISEENDAVSSYNEKVKYLEELGYVDEAKVLLDIASEELVHIGELEALLMKNGISADIQTINGIEEVNDKLGEEIN